MEDITAVIDTLISVAGSVMNFAMENKLLSICLIAGTVIPAGFALFRNAKHTVE